MADTRIPNVERNDASLQRDPVSPDVSQRLSKGPLLYLWTIIFEKQLRDDTREDLRADFIPTSCTFDAMENGKPSVRVINF